jgi:hypothetical protein
MSIVHGASCEENDCCMMDEDCELFDHCVTVEGLSGDDTNQE